MTLHVTGPAPGKIPIGNHGGHVCNDTCMDLADATVYIHVRGYADAQVTHIDVEGGLVDELWGMLSGGSGGDRVGVLLVYTGGDLYVYSDAGDTVMVLHLGAGPDSDVSCRGIVGRKEGGIYIGLCGELIEILEGYASSVHGVEPK